ncbi:MAG: hypothetical protein WBK38_04970 [Bacteroidia bacterium]
MKHYLVILTLLLAATVTQAQVGIGTASPNTTAILDITASAKGLIVPRMTTTERDNSIKTPTAGLLIYNTTSNALEIVNGSSLWVNLSTGTTTAVTSGTTSSTAGIGLGTTSPNANAILDITSTTQGVLLPRHTADPTGVAGMVYYNTTDHAVKVYNGTAWIALTN